jgi:hypothetical protein
MPTEYQTLVAERKHCRKCASDLINPAEGELAIFDSEEIGPWATWLGALPAKVVVIRKDWGTRTVYKNQRGRVKPRPTNNRLRLFLSELGFSVGAVGGSDRDLGVFLTNAVLCLQPGTSMVGNIPNRCFVNCGSFLRRTIEVTGARVAVCLGPTSFNATMRAFGRQTPDFASSVELARPVDLGAILVFAAFHPAARPVNRTEAEQRADWRRIRQRIETVVPPLDSESVLLIAPLDVLGCHETRGDIGVLGNQAENANANAHELALFNRLRARS